MESGHIKVTMYIQKYNRCRQKTSR